MAIKKFRKGERLSSRHLNQPVDALRKGIRGGKGIIVTRAGDRITIAATGTAPISRGGSAGVLVKDDFAALNAITTADDGDLGYVEDKDRFYGYAAGAWVVLATFIDSAAPSSVGERNGDQWYDTTNNYLFILANGLWRIGHQFQQAAAPTAHVGNGDTWYDTVNNRPFLRVNGAWESMAWAKADNKLYYYDGTDDQIISHIT